jgi:hypothetical protein
MPESPPHQSAASIEPRPEGVAAVHRPGLAPYRLLLFGGGALAGLGLHSHNLGLPGAVADALAERSGRGVDLTVVVEPEPMSARALDGLQGLRLRRFDAVIVVLGERPALARMPPQHWTKDLERLADLLEAESAEQARAYVYDSARAMLAVSSGVPRKVAATAARHAALAEEIAAVSTLAFRELPPPQYTVSLGRRFSSVTYQDWADLIVQRLHLGPTQSEQWLSSSTPNPLRDRADDEDLRQRALQSLGLRADERDELLQFIVRQAKVTFRAGGAALNIVDGERQWPKATVGTAARAVPREAGFCNVTIQSDGLTLIYDSHRDPRVSESPVAQAPDGVRFYAGYPVRTWDGYRIGTLCIYDDYPRYLRESDLAPLRDFAARIEQELWSAALHRTG